MSASAQTRPLVWDAWRDAYDTLDHADQEAFYDSVFYTCRVQQQHNSERLAALLDHIAQPVTVVELGGWDGELAATMLAGGQVARWENWEISQAAKDNPVTDDPRYFVAGGSYFYFYWEIEHDCDVFVASHVLEHLRFAHVCAVLDRTDARWLYLDVPVTEAGRDWTGYNGSHILEVGWHMLHAAVVGGGYDPLPNLSDATIRCYERVA